MNKRCAVGASRIKVKNRVFAVKIADVVNTHDRQKRCDERRNDENQK